MASYNELLALIDAYINQNGVQAITGQVLNGVLRAMVDQLGRGYSIMGAADPTTDPGTPDGPETWFASVPGTYTNFDGIQIVDGELALLSYEPSAGFSKNTIYEGFQTVQATIDGNVGTPAVGVSYANGILSFDFHNMKGVTGDPAGFGAVTASVDSNIGTPSVQVQTSGPDTAKAIAFQFHNLKGETGVTSVLATVDNTSGNPQCAVSLNGQQLVLNFTGLKGAQGDTGSSVDYPFTIVNNLTTNDATQALSAAMGVQLESEVSQLEAKVDEIALTEKLEIARDSISAGVYVDSNGNLSAWGAAKVYVYPVTPGKVIKIYGGKGRSASVNKYAFYSSNSLSSATCVFVSGKSTDDAYIDKLVVPAGSAFIGVSVVDNATTGVYSTGGIDDDNVIGSRQIKPSAFDAIPTVGSNKLLASGIIASLLNNIIQESFVPGDSFTHTVLNDSFVDSLGGISSWVSSKVFVYPVTEKTIINIHGGKGSSSAVYKYAFYNSANPGENSLVAISGTSTDSDYCDNVIVPLGATHIAVSVVNNAPTGVSLIAGLNSNGVIDISKLNPSIFDDAPIENSGKLLSSGTIYKEVSGLSESVYQEKTPDSVISGKYVGGYGVIYSYVSYKLNAYNVVQGETYKMLRTVSPQGAALAYAIYSTNNESLWGSDTCVEASNFMITGGNTQVDIEIPEGGVCLVVTLYPGGGYEPTINEQTLKRFNIRDFDQLKEEVNRIGEEQGLGFCAELANDGENLYIAYLDGVVEYTYWFKKCMANNLYTFYRIGYRTVSRDYADTDGISSGTGITYLNSTDSDNIGPLGFVTGGLVGGNHLWNNDYELNCKTAKNDSYTIFFDDKIATAGDKKYCKKVNVLVVNTLYNPSETPTAGQTILTIPASTETVMYEVREKNIFVSVRQKLADNNNNVLSRYYGMQSMFSGEQYYMTPRGEFVDWTAKVDDSFKKEDYPSFNRFLEKNANGYQSTYLIPNKAGAHTLLGNASNIWSYAGVKQYHQIFAAGNFSEPTPGLQFVWSGVYTFFKDAIKDDSNVFVYEGIVNGKHAIFINAKQACSANIPLPEKFLSMKMHEVERDATITTDNEFVDVDGVSIVATGTGSFIFTLE